MKGVIKIHCTAGPRSRLGVGSGRVRGTLIHHLGSSGNTNGRSWMCLVRSYSPCIIDAVLSRPGSRGAAGDGGETAAVDRGWPFRGFASFMHVYGKPFRG